MKNIFSKYKDIISKNWRKAIFLSVLFFICFFAYSVYLLFNGSPDPEAIANVKAQTQATDIKFDVKTIDKLLELKAYTPPAVNLSGKNPFQPY